MFSRDDSDRRIRTIDDITSIVCFAALFFGCVIGALAYPVVILVPLVAVVLLSFIWQAYRRIRRRLSRPDEHETNYADRVG